MLGRNAARRYTLYFQRTRRLRNIIHHVLRHGSYALALAGILPVLRELGAKMEAALWHDIAAFTTQTCAHCRAMGPLLRHDMTRRGAVRLWIWLGLDAAGALPDTTQPFSARFLARAPH